MVSAGKVAGCAGKLEDQRQSKWEIHRVISKARLVGRGLIFFFLLLTRSKLLEWTSLQEHSILSFIPVLTTWVQNWIATSWPRLRTCTWNVTHMPQTGERASFSGVLRDSHPLQCWQQISWTRSTCWYLMSYLFPLLLTGEGTILHDLSLFKSIKTFMHKCDHKIWINHNRAKCRNPRCLC